MYKTVALFSSSRNQGNTRQLLKAVSDQYEVDIIDLSEHVFSEYDYEHKNTGDDFLPLIKKVLSYEKIIFASPVYWYSVTPKMKKFLDRISDLLDMPELLDLGREFRNKTAYVLCTSVSREVSPAFIAALEDTFNYLGMSYGGYLHAACSDNYNENDYKPDILNFSESLRDNDLSVMN